jgi:16S rRNA (cytidine1402-2'-O)-methyltransferase
MNDSPHKGALHIVATPIGNLEDITLRALRILKEADVILAEDTRHTRGLCTHYDIHTKLESYHIFNEHGKCASLVKRILNGEDIALVTDAGMPCVSDPGYLLVEAAVAAGVPVTAVPGPCAAVTAVAVSGFNALSFAFYGFLPRTAGDIRKVLRRVEKEYSPLSVFYESPNRITDTVELVGEVLPDFRVCVCNDLTKKFERIYRGTPEQVLEQLKSNPNASKGEYVLLLERSKTEQKEDTAKLSPEALLVDRMVKDGVSAKEAVALLTAEKVLPKRELYDAALRLRELL